MFKIYGSVKCPDCRNCKLNFDLYNIIIVWYEVML